MLDFREIIGTWPSPSVATFAADVEQKPATVKQWFWRNTLPSHVWLRATTAARERRLRGVTLRQLATIAERKAAA